MNYCDECGKEVSEGYMQVRSTILCDECYAEFESDLKDWTESIREKDEQENEERNQRKD